MATLTGGGDGVTFAGIPAGTGWAAPVDPAPAGGWMRECTSACGGKTAPFEIPAPGCAGVGMRPRDRCGGERGDSDLRSVFAGVTSREGPERAISRRRTGDRARRAAAMCHRLT